MNHLAINTGKGKSASLVPVGGDTPVIIDKVNATLVSQNDLHKPAKRTEVDKMKRRKEVQPMRFPLLPDTPENAGTVPVLGAIVGQNAQVYVNVMKEDKAKQKAEELKSKIKSQTGLDVEITVPIPVTHVVSYG